MWDGWDFVDDLCFLLQASDTISVSSNPEGLMQVVKSPRQRLVSGSQALIKWAAEHGYNPITSYTNTPVANHFSIRLREPGKMNSTTDFSNTLHNLNSVVVYTIFVQLFLMKFDQITMCVIQI